MAALFRTSEGRGRGRGPDLEEQLAELERQAGEASPGYETQFLNRAGNLCVEAGQPTRALGYYGRAIDKYLESGRFNAAEVVCRKVLQISPEAVRARCTLAWLSIGKGYREEAERELESYVRAARRVGAEPLAVKQLRMMAEAAASADLRDHIAEHLLELDDPSGANRVYREIQEERGGMRPPPIPDEGRLWAKLLRAALMGPRELRSQAAEEGGEENLDDLLPSLTEEAGEEAGSRED